MTRAVADPNFNLYPPGGYSYPDPGSGITFSGGNWPEVIEKIRSYREANDLPAGNPEREVFTWFCRRHPAYCHEGKVARQYARLAESQAGFASAMQAWIADTFSKVNSRKLGYVSREEYERRAKICSQCPRQREWSVGCAGCERNLKAVIKQTLGKRKPSDSLAGCSLLREQTSVSCHLTLEPVTLPGMPSRCWRKDQ